MVEWKNESALIQPFYHSLILPLPQPVGGAHEGFVAADEAVG